MMKKILTLCMAPASELWNSEDRGNQWGEEELRSFNVLQFLHIHALLGKSCKHDRAVNSGMHKKGARKSKKECNLVA